MSRFTRYLLTIALGNLVVLFSSACATNAYLREPLNETPTPRSAEPAEATHRALPAVEQEILAAWGKTRSGSATFVHEALKPVGTLGGEDPQDLKLGVHSKGTLDFLKKDERLLHRMVMTCTVGPGHGPGVLEGPVERMTTEVFDGEYLHSMAETGTRVKAFKVKMKHSGPPFISGGRLLLDRLRSAYGTLTLEPDEKIDGRETYVICGRAEAIGGVLLGRYWVDKKTGVMLRRTLYTPEDTPVQVLSVKNLKVNVEFPKGHFTFVPPEGVEVEDLTKRGYGYSHGGTPVEHSGRPAR